MPDTIKLHLRENRSIQAEFNGRPYSFEGGINIVAGEENATQFEIASVPDRLKGATVSLAMTNSLREQVEPPTVKNNIFALPIGMAVAGYGQFVITLHKKGERVVFLPFKVRVAKTDPRWRTGVINVIPLQIGETKSLPEGSEPYVKNVGTDLMPVLEFGLPKGGAAGGGQTTILVDDDGNERKVEELIFEITKKTEIADERAALSIFQSTRSGTVKISEIPQKTTPIKIISTETQPRVTLSIRDEQEKNTKKRS